MRESSNLPPEVELETRASLYQIKPYRATRQELISFYNDDINKTKGLRWSLNKNNFTIKIWKDPEYHIAIDANAYNDGTTGYVNKKTGVTYSDSRVLSDKEKQELVFSLKKYLNG